MNSEFWPQLLLRLLPSVVVVILAFVASNETRTRQRWADLLYQMGSIRPDQRDDPKIQRGVRLPFLVVAVALLAWPVLYYQYSTRTFEIKTDLYSRPVPAKTAAPATTAANTAAATPAAPGSIYGTPAPGAPAGNSTTAPAAPAAPAPRTNIYGTPVP